MATPDPCVLVVFGATGDLSRRKLVPALETLYCKGLLPQPFRVLGTGRRAIGDDRFRDDLRAALDAHGKESDRPRRDAFLSRFHFTATDTLPDRLTDLWNADGMPRNALFYLALPPKAYEGAIDTLRRSGLNGTGNGWRRVVVEKPFGFDLDSARRMNRTLLAAFDEERVFRIDHYLGKETVQNILALRFGNGLFEPLWNAHHIHHVEITAAEDIGTGGRAQYFDGIGVLRDMVQNHLLQVLATVAMEPPVRFDATAVRNETAKVFDALQPIDLDRVAESAVRGQYMPGRVRGEDLPAYRDEPGVPEGSRTETFAALKVHLDNWRWSGVPFYLRTGKRLPTKVTEVVVRFRDPPHQYFRTEDGGDGPASQLVIRIQPDEGILLGFGMKVPGEGFHLQGSAMDFHYSDLGGEALPSAYERLLLDGMLGDVTLFARTDAVERCWTYIDPILAAWGTDPGIPLYGYPSGSWGPPQAADLFEPGYDFRYPCRILSADDGFCTL